MKKRIEKTNEHWINEFIKLFNWEAGRPKSDFKKGRQPIYFTYKQQLAIFKVAKILKELKKLTN